MKVIDEVLIKIRAGNGGDGNASFNYLPYVTKIGPTGGNGGNGGDIVFMAVATTKTFANLRFAKEIIAESGLKGNIRLRQGKNGKDCIVKVPLFTKIINEKTGHLMADITELGKKYIIAKGGAGGRGNAKLFNKTKMTDHNIFEFGKSGQTFTIKLTLDILADVALVGLPNAGKSSLLAKISNAKPQIADYPFTTVNPLLGIVKTNHTQKEFLIMDLPGLIAGASQGKGLGSQILNYIKKCKMIIHLIDMAGNDNESDILANYQLIRNELLQYQNGLENKIEIIVANKMDLVNAKANLKQFSKQMPTKMVVPISTFDKKSLQHLINVIADNLKV